MTIIRSTDRDSYRTDEGSGRFYWWQGEGPFISVTNAIKLGIPSPYIAPWYAKVVAEHVDKYWDIEGDIRASCREAGAPEAFVKSLKALPVETRDAAGEFGTQVHDICESIMLRDPSGGTLTGDDMKIIQRVRQFIDFEKVMKPEYIAVEGIVFNREYGYAGAFDILCDLPGHGRVIIDIKTGKGVYGSAAIQQTAYRHGEFIAVGTDEVPMIETDGAMVLHLQATQWRLLPVETGEQSWSVFKSALHTAKWIIEHEAEAVGKPLVKGKG
ncbi:hypothetical protein LCGC14_1248860 [marine sediment metagenome]|uniref:PD-(D/E)XK endonuclease-like domain-containing protein n=1 Tax=marine sediment metagenome TaxID=412755 RepID=A0A0F9L3L1_9ZZZZ